MIAQRTWLIQWRNTDLHLCPSCRAGWFFHPATARMCQIHAMHCTEHPPTTGM